MSREARAKSIGTRIRDYVGNSAVTADEPPKFAACDSNIILRARDADRVTPNSLLRTRHSERDTPNVGPGLYAGPCAPGRMNVRDGARTNSLRLNITASRDLAAKVLCARPG
jgi:hypothetical protein